MLVQASHSEWQPRPLRVCRFLRVPLPFQVTLCMCWRAYSSWGLVSLITSILRTRPFSSSFSNSTQQVLYKYSRLADGSCHHKSPFPFLPRNQEPSAGTQWAAFFVCVTQREHYVFHWSASRWLRALRHSPKPYHLDFSLLSTHIFHFLTRAGEQLGLEYWLLGITHPWPLQGKFYGTFW